MRFRIVGTPEKSAGERKSRIHNTLSQRRESGDGMDAMEMAGSSGIDNKILRVSHLMPQYEQYHSSGEEAEGDAAE